MIPCPFLIMFVFPLSGHYITVLVGGWQREGVFNFECLSVGRSGAVEDPKLVFVSCNWVSHPYLELVISNIFCSSNDFASAHVCHDLEHQWVNRSFLVHFLDFAITCFICAFEPLMMIPISVVYRFRVSFGVDDSGKTMELVILEETFMNFTCWPNFSTYSLRLALVIHLSIVFEV